MKLYKLSIPMILSLGLLLIWLLAFSPKQVAQAYPPNVINVNTTIDEFDLTPDATCSLREAIQTVNLGAGFGGCSYVSTNVISLPAGVYSLTLSGSDEDDNATGDLDIKVSMTIGGAGVPATLINGNQIDRVFDIHSGTTLVTFSGVMIRNGKVTGSGDKGGGIKADSDELDLIDAAVVSNVAPQGYGGGIYFAGNTLILTNTAILSNTASRGGGIDLDYGNLVFNDPQNRIAGNEAQFGGGIRNTGGDIVMGGGKIEKNTANGYDGAGIYSTGSIIMRGGKISGNAAGRSGGGIYIVSGNFTLRGGEVANNVAGEDGGGVYITTSGMLTGRLTQTGTGSITHNTAEEGGGIYVDDGNVVIQAGQVISNTALMSGGGIYVHQGKAILGGGQVSNNTANYGGGVHLNDGSFLLDGSEILDNVADYGGGVYIGGVNARGTDNTYISASTAVFTQTGDSTIAGNIADMDGGGIYIFEGTVSLNDGQIYSNTANSGGGGLFLHSASTTVDGVQIASNNADKGGGVYADDDALIRNAQIVNNTAEDGGGMYVGYGDVVISNTQITTNTADKGGGVLVHSGYLQIINTTLHGNRANHGPGGGLYADGGLTTLNRSTVTNNTADAGGRGLHWETGAYSVTPGNTIVANNSPQNCNQGMFSAGYNLDDDGSCGFISPGDQPNTDPKLGPLANNGGGTLTRALLRGSPAIDAGSCQAGITTDQRGWPRPNPGSSFCDIGAFEANVGGMTDLILTKTVTPVAAAPGQPITYTLTYSHTGPSGAVKVMISDDFPIQVSGAKITSHGAKITLLPGTHFTWAVQDLPPGAGGVIIITGNLKVPLATGVFTNTATISSATVDSNPTNNTSAVGVTVLNMPPVALDNHYTTAEDTPLNVVTPGVLANDNDPNGDTLMAVLDAGPSHGTLVLAADGSLSYTSSLDFTGTDTFTYHASDGILASNVATVTINVGAVNDPPTALADSYTTSEDTHLTVDTPGVLANDSDPNGDTLMAALDAGPSHGTLVLAADGSFSYTPSLDFTGTDTFTYHASDGSLNSNVTTVTISVTEQAGADLAVSKDVSALTPAEGDTITYTIQITNIGSNAATGVVVTDLLPTGVTHVSDDSNGSYNPADGSWNVGDLNVGESVILHITATVDVGTAGTTITNIATISAVHQTDPNPNNNTDVAAITVKTGWMTVYLPLILK